MRCVKMHDWHCRSQHRRGSRCSWPICPDFLLSNLSGGMLNAKQCLLTAAIVIGGTACAWAQGLNDPKAEYLSHCAGCHGDGAKGDGPLSTRLTIKPADLTVLSRKNKGVFPVSAVYAAVDGRNAIPSHGAMRCRSGGVDLRHRLFCQTNPRDRTYPTRMNHISTSPAIRRTSLRTVFCPLSNICGEFRSLNRRTTVAFLGSHSLTTPEVERPILL